MLSISPCLVIVRLVTKVTRTLMRAPAVIATQFPDRYVREKLL